MNYAGLLGLVAATAFALPLLTQLGEYAGLPRLVAIALSLLLAAVAAAWLATAAYRAQRRPQLPPAEATDEAAKASGVPADSGNAAVGAAPSAAVAPPPAGPPPAGPPRAAAAATIAEIDAKEERNASI